MIRRLLQGVHGVTKKVKAARAKRRVIRQANKHARAKTFTPITLPRDPLVGITFHPGKTKVNKDPHAEVDYARG